MVTTTTLVAASLLVSTLLLASLPTRCFGFSLKEIVNFKPGSQPASCSQDLLGEKEGRFYNITPACSPHYFHYCAATRDNNVSYVPNSFGQVMQSYMKTTFDALDGMLKAYLTQYPPSKTGPCMSLLIPYLCNAIYPTTLAFDKVKLFFGPCRGFCEDVFEVCHELLEDASSVGLSIKNCSEMLHDNEDNDGTCIKSPLDPPSCFKECKDCHPPPLIICSFNCTREDSKCDTIQVRNSISKRQFPRRKYEFTAEVEVLEEVLLCKPVVSMAYKVKIIRDFFLGCKTCETSCPNEIPSGSITYVLSTDSINNCDKRCVQQKMKIGERYLMAGTYHKNEDLTKKCNTKVWVLDSVKTANCLLYPWDKYVGKNKNKKLFGTVLENYKCTAPCRRNSGA